MVLKLKILISLGNTIKIILLNHLNSGGQETVGCPKLLKLENNFNKKMEKGIIFSMLA